MVQNWSLDTIDLRGDETLVLHHADEALAAPSPRPEKKRSTLTVQKKAIFLVPKRSFIINQTRRQSGVHNRNRKSVSSRF